MFVRGTLGFVGNAGCSLASLLKAIRKFSLTITLKPEAVPGSDQKRPVRAHPVRFRVTPPADPPADLDLVGAV